jgi:hypothetical protein
MKPLNNTHREFATGLRSERGALCSSVPAQWFGNLVTRMISNATATQGRNAYGNASALFGLDRNFTNTGPLG